MYVARDRACAAVYLTGCYGHTRRLPCRGGWCAVKIYKGRGQRFAAVPNETCDDNDLTITELGLLTWFLRNRDGWEDDVESIARRRGPGREALTRAMQTLVRLGYVVKVKHQDTRTGRWKTSTFVFDVPATAGEVAELLAEFRGCRAVRVEPRRFDSKQAPTNGFPSPGYDQEKQGGSGEFSQAAPTVGEPTVGEPTVGNPSALSEDGSEHGCPDPEEPEMDALPEPDTGTRATAAGIVDGLDRAQLARIDANATQRAQLVDDCVAALGRGVDPGVLAAYLSTKLGEARTVKYLRGALDAGRLPAGATCTGLGLQQPRGHASPVPPWCGQCDPQGQHQPGQRRVQDGDGRWRVCPACHPQAGAGAAAGAAAEAGAAAGGSDSEVDVHARAQQIRQQQGYTRGTGGSAQEASTSADTDTEAAAGPVPVGGGLDALTRREGESEAAYQARAREALMTMALEGAAA